MSRTRPARAAAAGLIGLVLSLCLAAPGRPARAQQAAPPTGGPGRTRQASPAGRTPTRAAPSQPAPPPPSGSVTPPPGPAATGATRATQAPSPADTRPPDSTVPILRPQLPTPTLSAAVKETREAPPRERESRLLARALQIPESSDFQVFGWIQNSFTGNPSVRPGGLNFGVNPNNLANEWMGNQYYLVLTRRLRQDDSINFGFRIDALSGNDWQFNHMQGLFDRAFRLNSFLGFDPAQLYASVHLPILTPRGLEIIGGRWYTIVGYEGVPAVSRPLLSVPYMFNYGQPFTHFGVLSTLHLSPHLDLFNGTVNGWDRWIDERYRWGYIGGLSYTSEGARDHFALTGIWGPNQFPRFLPADQPIFPTGYISIPGLAGLPNPGYDRNDRTLLTWVFSHEWSKRLVQTIETDQGWERSIPGLASHGRNYAPLSDAWYSFGNWFFYKFNDRITGIWRSEWFRDVYGARTGYAGNFYEMTLGLNLKPRPWLLVRPEVRFDWSQFCHPYDSGTSNHQWTLGMDVVFRF